MSVDQVLAVIGLLVGFIGVVATIWMGVWAVMDGRRQRSERERAVIVAHGVIERSYGLLIGLKPCVAELGTKHEAAINDGLAAINQQRANLSKL